MFTSLYTYRYLRPAVDYSHHIICILYYSVGHRYTIRTTTRLSDDYTVIVNDIHERLIARPHAIYFSLFPYPLLAHIEK